MAVASGIDVVVPTTMPDARVTLGSLDDALAIQQPAKATNILCVNNIAIAFRLNATLQRGHSAGVA